MPRLSISGIDILNGCTNIVQRFLPHSCCLCGALSGRQPLCPGCHADLPWHSAPQCPRCASPTHDGAVCGQCLRKPPHFDRTLAVLTYAFPADALIQALKYRHQLPLVPALATFLAELAASAPRPDLVMPMPLHPSRVRERGFNQALELAKIVARQLDIPLLPRGSERIRATPPQVGLPWKERAANLRGAFSSDLDLAGKHVAIVDDVMTTGASLNELAKVLRRQGAREVSAWVVARTVAD